MPSDIIRLVVLGEFVLQGRQHDYVPTKDVVFLQVIQEEYMSAPVRFTINSGRHDPPGKA